MANKNPEVKWFCVLFYDGENYSEYVWANSASSAEKSFFHYLQTEYEIGPGDDRREYGKVFVVSSQMIEESNAVCLISVQRKK